MFQLLKNDSEFFILFNYYHDLSVDHDSFLWKLLREYDDLKEKNTSNAYLNENNPSWFKLALKLANMIEDENIVFNYHMNGQKTKNLTQSI